MLITLIRPPQITRIQQQAEDYHKPGFAYRILRSLTRERKKSGKISSELWHPLGLLSIASYLRTHGHDVNLIDLNFQEFKNDINGIIGVSLDGHVDESLVDLLRQNRSKGNLLIAGGFEATFHYSELLMNDLIDIIVLGEGELTIIELLDHIEKNEDWREVKGIAYKGPERIIINPRSIYSDLETLPLPDRTLIDIEKYKESNPWVNVITSRGCPRKGRCGFCGKTQHIYRVQSIEKTIEEMKLLYNYGYRKFHFGDDYFISSKEYIMELCSAIINNFTDIRWRCQVHVYDCDEVVLRKMKAAGCEQIGLGVESFNQKTLDTTRKDFTIPQLKDVMKIYREVRMSTSINLIIGLPYESPRLFLANLVKYSFSIKPSWIVISILRITHCLSLRELKGFGAPFQRNPEKFGIHFKDDTGLYCGIPINIREVDSISGTEFSAFQKAYPLAIIYSLLWNRIVNLSLRGLPDRLIGMAGILLKRIIPQLYFWLKKIKTK